MSSFGAAPAENCKGNRGLLGRHNMPMGVNFANSFTSERTCVNDQTQLDYYPTLEGLVAHQV